MATARCPCLGLGWGPVGFAIFFHFNMGAAMMTVDHIIFSYRPYYYTNTTTTTATAAAAAAAAAATTAVAATDNVTPRAARSRRSAEYAGVLSYREKNRSRCLRSLRWSSTELDDDDNSETVEGSLPTLGNLTAFSMFRARYVTPGNCTFRLALTSLRGGTNRERQTRPNLCKFSENNESRRSTFDNGAQRTDYSSRTLRNLLK